jgi:hypothetical protein
VSPYRGQRLFRTAPWILVAVSVSEALFLIGACYTYLSGGWSLTSVVLTAMAVLGAGGVAEALVRRILLEEDALYVTDLLARRRYARHDIVRVEVAKGCPVALQLADGRWARLPDLGRNVANSIRAWLRAAP